jgi:hypothetical protein
MKEVLKKKVTRKQFLKAGLGLVAGTLAGFIISSNLNKYKANDSYGNSVYGGGG